MKEVNEVRQSEEVTLRMRGNERGFAGRRTADRGDRKETLETGRSESLRFPEKGCALITQLPILCNTFLSQTYVYCGESMRWLPEYFSQQVAS